MKDLYIFDLNGTLANLLHRRHFVSGETKDWRGFFDACSDDAPIPAVIATMEKLAMSSDIWIWSGRSDECRSKTILWLEKHTHLRFMQIDPILKMRKAGDRQDDETLKASWLDEMSEDDRKRLVAIFDDRDRVAAMWRSRGVPCFQVAPGDF